MNLSNFNSGEVNSWQGLKVFFKVLMTRQISGTNRKDDNFTKRIVNFFAILHWFWCCQKAFVVSAHSGKSAAVATPPAFTLGLMENCGGCCLGDDIPETTQVVRGLGNVLWVVEMQTEIHHWRIQSTYTRVYPGNALGSWRQPCLIEVCVQCYFAIQQSVNCPI